jgi:hypothetical protein
MAEGVPLPLPEPEWAQEEFATANIGDKRLNKRLGMIVEAFAQNPNAQIPQATGRWPKAKAAYRFFDNKKVSVDNILEPHRNATKERAQGRRLVLAVQDTSDLNYSHHPCTEGLGLAGNEFTRGMIIHPTLAVSTEGIPLGLIDLQQWTRDPEEPEGKDDHHMLPIEEKESFKWLTGYRSTAALQQELEDTHFVVVCDREGDIFELLGEAERAREDGKTDKPDVLVRASWDRNVWHPQGHLWAQLESQEPAGELVVQVPRKKGQREREATLTIRYAPVTIDPPKRIPRRASICKKITVWAVYAHEESAPKGVDPLSWMLLSTMPVTSFEDAIERIAWYVLRWVVELFFKTMKSGCRVEDRQLQTRERLEKCIAVDCIVAWRVMFLTTMGREVPNLPASALFEEYEWKALHCFVHRTPTSPEEEPTLGEVVREVAKMGGFLARRRDGHPGMMTLWRGLLVLRSVSVMWLVFNDSR